MSGNPIIIIALVLLSFQQPLFSQDTSRLIREIESASQIESSYISCFGHQSALFKKADSLNELTDIQTKLALLNHNSHVLKYYTFNGLLYQNDSIAFESLKILITDSTIIDYQQLSFGSSDNFNQFLLEDYLNYIQAKYKEGGGHGFDGHAFLFPPRNKKLYKFKHKQLMILLDQTNTKHLLDELYR